MIRLKPFRRSLLLGLLPCLLLGTERAGASQFVAYPGLENASNITFHPQGQVAWLTRQCDNGSCSGTLYVDGQAFVNFGPSRAYTDIFDIALTGNKVLFSARVREDLRPDGCNVRGFNGVFDSATPILCRPGTTTHRNWGIERPIRRLVAASNGDYAFVDTILGGTGFVISPSQGEYVFANTWTIPSWRNIEEFSPPSAVPQLGLVGSGDLLARRGNCLQRFERQSSSLPTGLTLAEETCFAELINPTSTASNFNSNTGTALVCAGPTNEQQFFLLGPGGPAATGITCFFGSSTGNDSATLNVSNVFAFQLAGGIALSTAPERVQVATGHQLNNAIVFQLRQFAVSNSGTIIAVAQMRDLSTDELTWGLLYADGNTDFPDPPAESELIWSNTDGGGFDVAGNWQGNAVPDETQVAVFDSDAGYAVDFAGAVGETDRVRVRRGDVDFAGGAYELISGSAAYPGVNVEMGARLDIIDGHQLNSQFASIAPSLLNGAGAGLVALQGNGSSWTNQGRLLIGDGGSGTLLLNADATVDSGSARIGNGLNSMGRVEVGDGQNPAQWTSGNLSIGHYGIGELNLNNPALLFSDEVTLATFEGSQATATTSSSWNVSTDLTIGRRGQATLASTDGAILSVDAGGVVVGQYDGSSGQLSIDSGSAVLVSDSVTVGNQGDGQLSVTTGGSLVGNPGATDPVNELVIGNNGGDGLIVVSGVSATPTADPSTARAFTLRVGNGGHGSAFVLGGARLESFTATVGLTGTGRVVIDDASWQPLPGDSTLVIVAGSSQEISTEAGTARQSLGVGEIVVRNNGVIDGDITIDGPESRLSGDGSVTGGVAAINEGVIAPGNSPGELTIDGALILDDGALEIEITGTDSQAVDAVVVSGQATLTGTIRFVFPGAYVPRQGDQVTFLESTSSIDLSNTAFEYDGIDSGFEFEVIQDMAGQLRFVALNDGFRDVMFGDGFEGQ